MKSNPDRPMISPKRIALGFIDAARYYDQDIPRGFRRLKRGDIPNREGWQSTIDIVTLTLFVVGQFAFRTLIDASIAITLADGVTSLANGFHSFGPDSYRLAESLGAALGLVYGFTSYPAMAGRKERRQTEARERRLGRLS